MNILKIQQYDINNGDGVRVSIWTAGCSHHCKGCWSPNTWNPNQGRSLEECIPEIEYALRDPNIDGVSIIGGDPLYEAMEFNNLKDINVLLDICIEKNKSIWLWTGYIYEDIPDEIKDKCDVIIDGKFEEDKKDLSLKYRGSSNQRVILCKNNSKMFGI